MAVEFCTDSSNRCISPRISFSHDLNQSEIVPIEPHIPFKSSLQDHDFNFCVSRRSCDDQGSSLADEIFENGVILPIQIKVKNLPTKLNSPSSSLPSSSSSLPPLPASSVSDYAEIEEKQGKNNNNKSFWKFRRSKSLNCGSIYKAGLCPLPLLSRSKSTGSTASVKSSLVSKDEVQNHYHHNYGMNVKQSYQKNSNSTHHQKPPLKKNYGSSFNSGVVQVSPVLNVPTGKLLGLGSVFSNGKNKSKKK